MQLQPPSCNRNFPGSKRFKAAGAGALGVTPAPSPLPSLTARTVPAQRVGAFHSPKAPCGSGTRGAGHTVRDTRCGAHGAGHAVRDTRCGTRGAGHAVRGTRCGHCAEPTAGRSCGDAPAAFSPKSGGYHEPGRSCDEADLGRGGGTARNPNIS